LGVAPQSAQLPPLKILRHQNGLVHFPEILVAGRKGCILVGLVAARAELGAPEHCTILAALVTESWRLWVNRVTGEEC
jgi:hypothetical protein